MTKRLAAILSCLVLMCALAATATTAQAAERERHPEIRKAIGALERARGDLRSAAHDYCGHRAEALEATDNAIRQLRLALESDRADFDAPRDAPPAAFFGSAVYVVPASVERERHPKIWEAVHALERARRLAARRTRLPRPPRGGARSGQPRAGSTPRRARMRPPLSLKGPGKGE